MTERRKEKKIVYMLLLHELKGTLSMLFLCSFAGIRRGTHFRSDLRMSKSTKRGIVQTVSFPSSRLVIGHEEKNRAFITSQNDCLLLFTMNT
jgi:hypothetical protein